MSRLLEPSGPLSPRVYWTRRLVVLVGLVLVVALAWWAIDRATATGASSSPPRSAATHHPATPTGASSSPSSSSAAHHRTTQRQASSASGTSPRPSAHRPAPSSPRQAKQQPTLAVPTHTLGSTPAASGGACQAGTVGIAIHATAMVAGNPHNITLWLTAPQGSSCTLSLGPDSVVVQLTSGSDRIWSSDDCPDALPTKSIRVTGGTPARYTFQWDGFRSTKGCRNDVSMAKPGGYWVHAALLGGEPTEAYFAVKPRT